MLALKKTLSAQLFIAMMTLLLAACSEKDALEVDISKPDEMLAVGRFHVTGEAAVNTWWVHAPEGLIVIDYQRDTESALQAIEAIRSENKPVKALLLTHAHPDHIGGLAQFKAAFPDAPLYASATTTEEIRSDSMGYQKLTRQVLGDIAPSSYPLPDKQLEAGVLELAGTQIEVKEYGPGESVSATVYYLPKSKQLFSGDIVGNAVSDFLLEQRTGAWLAQLDVLANDFPRAARLYPGHGDSGNAKALIDEQKGYLNFFRTEVQLQIDAGHWNGDGLSDEAAKKVAEAVETKYPGRPAVAKIPQLLELNANAVAVELMSSDINTTDD